MQSRRPGSAKPELSVGKQKCYRGYPGGLNMCEGQVEGFPAVLEEGARGSRLGGRNHSQWLCTYEVAPRP